MDACTKAVEGTADSKGISNVLAVLNASGERRVAMLPILYRRPARLRDVEKPAMRNSPFSR